MKQFESGPSREPEGHYTADETQAAGPERHESESRPKGINYQQFKQIAAERKGLRERTKVIWGTRLRALDSNLRHHNLPPLFEFSEEEQYEIKEAELKRQSPYGGGDEEAWLRRESNEEEMFRKEILLLGGVEAYLGLTSKQRWELGGEGTELKSPSSEVTTLLGFVLAKYGRPDSIEEKAPRPESNDNV